MTTIFEATPDHRLALIRETPPRFGLGRPTRAPVPFDVWPMERPSAAAAGVARLLAALGDGERMPDGAAMIVADADSATLHPALVARLSDAEATGLALPPATRLSLSLQSSGLITRPDFRIDARWTKPGGVPVRANVTGATLHHEGRDWRVPEPLFSTLAEVAAVNAAPDEAARQAALSRLKRAIGDEAGGQIAPDGQIERLRLSYASGFSLALRASAAGFDFDPVLFGRERLDAAEDGAVLDEADDGLLPPALAAGFARRFRQGDGERRAYLLDDGSLLFLDPELTRAMGVVRQAQRGTPEQRRAFARAPHRAIADALGGEALGGENAAPGLFIETQQFSERVAGVDVWRKPVLPWIKPKPDSWLPERFGLSIGEGADTRTLEIAPDQVERVQAAARQAVRENRASFTFEGEEVPATQATLAALDSLSTLIAAAPTSHDNEDEAPPPALAGRYFLQVRDNLEDVAYAPLVLPAMASATPPPDMPAALASAPKPHQIDGFRWLATCYLAGVPGALLADDMGLGKTFQALAFLAWLRGQEPHPRPVLIIAPTGLLANWRAEIERHLAPNALGRSVSAYGKGLAAMRDGPGRDIELGDSRVDVEALGSAGVVLTTYETMRDYHLSFARLRFSAIVWDEVQKLKNPASQMTRAAKTLNARFQLALTGTPVENRLQDLWSIFDVIHPGLLGSSRAFEADYPADPERLRALHDRLTLADGARPPLLLRRMKDDCLVGLPVKRIEALPMPMPMPPAQRAAYDRVIARALAVKGTGERGRMLEVLAALRGVSLHPVAPEEAGGAGDYWTDSARLATLFDLLGRVARAGEKILIFCESLAMQAMLAAEIARRFALPHPVIRIHGGVAGDARQQAVNVFQNRGPGFDAMILSPKAGGVGLTLTAANHVVHLSRWWNPAVEDQATDRAYRIGQTREVTVYLPQAVHPDPVVAPTSFDLKLHALVERKRTLSRGLLAPGDDVADADALFDEVVTEAAASAAAPTVEPVSPHPPIGNAEPVPRRSILGIKRDAPPPPAPARALPTWPRRVVYEPNTARDLTIFKAPVAADPVREMIIVDPYGCAGSRARQAVTDFAAMMIGDARALDRVQLVTYDADDVDLRDPESSAAQYDDMQQRWRARFGDRPVLHHQQRPKRQARDLHDREVRATTMDDRTLIWDLGRGIEGVMSNRFGCRVTLTED